MRKIQQLSFIFTITLAFIFSSCNNAKEEIQPTPEPTKSDLLVGSWRTTKIEVTINETTQDITNSLEDCTQDNLMVFEEENVFKLDEGVVKCNPDSPQTSTGSWRLNDDETELLIGDNTSQRFIIMNLNHTKARFSFIQDVDRDGQEDDTVMLTLTKQ